LILLNFFEVITKSLI